MQEKNKNKAERAFHQSRKAFVVLNDDILVAPDNFAGSHFDLLRQNGFDERQAKKIISRQPRGYVLDGSVYLYQGENFDCLSNENEEKIKNLVLFFQKKAWLKPDGKIYNGMHVGKIGEVWVPVKEFEIPF